MGDVVRLVDTSSVGWAGLRRWRLDRGTPAAAAGEVRQHAGTGGYRARRMLAGSARLAALPAVYDVLDTSGQAWLRIDLEKCAFARTAAATVSAGDAVLGVVPPVRRMPLGIGLTVTTEDDAPLLVVPDERGLSWSALDPAGLPVARVEHIATRTGWIDRRVRTTGPARAAARPDDDPSLSGDVISFERSSTPLQRGLVLGLAVCRAHPRY